MSFIVWNCHELENLHIGKELEAVIRAKDPFAVFIAKTWADESRLKTFNDRFILKFCFLWKEIIKEVDWRCTGKDPFF